MMSGQDTLTPALKREVEIGQTAFPVAYSTCYRRERLYRYCHFLKTGEKPSFNLIGSWLDDDITEEIALWKNVRAVCFDDDEATEYLMEVLQKRFACTWEETVVLGSNPALAEAHMPIWDIGTESLLPQKIGRCLIHGAYDYHAQNGRRDNGYSYRNDETGEREDIYLYEAGVPNIPDGIGDYILSQEIEIAVKGAVMMTERHGGEIHDMTGLVYDTLQSPSGAQWNLLSIGWCSKYPDGRHDWTSLGLTGFRGGLAKVRSTTPVGVQLDVEQSNADQAEYFFLFR